MKITTLLVLLFGASLLLTGCSTTAEDKAFFDQNWVHPTERDKFLGEE